MKNMLGIVLLLLGGSVGSGFISKATSSFIISKHTQNSVADTSSMVFPVAGKISVIGSFWGAVRDGGKRKHEGIDIFARKGTPVVAVTDGVVVDVGNTSRGGKTVWLRSSNNDFAYYYAHLDRQLVQPGQYVKKGDRLGTLGNSGNAKFTPSHLHFGIYTYAGAVNPLPYVKNLPKVAIQPKPTV